DPAAPRLPCTPPRAPPSAGRGRTSRPRPPRRRAAIRSASPGEWQTPGPRRSERSRSARSSFAGLGRQRSANSVDDVVDVVVAELWREWQGKRAVGDPLGVGEIAAGIAARLAVVAVE